MPNESSSLSKTESELFAIVNRTLDEQKLARWQSLIQLRESEQLSDDQRAELIRLGDELESLNVKRFQAVDELAKTRGVDFSDLCQQLQIVPS